MGEARQIKTILQVRTDESIFWSNANPILKSGEVGFDTTNLKLKIGDGSHHWTGLSFVNDDNIHKGTSSSNENETAYGRKTFANGITISGTGDNNALILNEGARINGPSNRTVFGFNSDNTGFLMNHPNYKLILRGSTTRPYYLTSGSAVDSNTPTLALYSDVAGLTTGTSSSTDNAVARFDGTTGKVIQNSNVTIADTGSLTIGGTWTDTSANNPYLSMGGYAKLTGNTSGAFTFAPSNTPSFLANTTEFRPISGTANAVDIGSASYGFRYGYFATGIQTAQIYTTGSTIKRISALAASPSTTYTYTLPNATGTIALTSDIPTVPTDYVDLSTNQTVGGIKSFASRPTYTATRLPNTYQEVKYLRFDGTSGYVDTGIVITQADNLTITAKIDIREYSVSKFATMFGYMASGTTPRCAVSIYQGKYMIGINATNSSSSDPLTGPQNYKFYTSGSSQILEVNGTNVVSTTYTSSALSGNTLSTYIGARNSGGTANNFADIDVYSFKVVHNATTYNLVPCYRVSDDKPGFYDLANSTFLPISGTVTVGADVEDSEFLVFNDLAEVAVSGSYNDLTDKPTIPSVSEFVSGPSSSTDNAIVRFDGTTGKIIQNSGVSIDDSSNLSLGENKYIYMGGTKKASFRANANGAFIIGAYDKIYFRGSLNSNDSSSASSGITFSTGTIAPEASSGTALGDASHKWTKVFATKLNNGNDISIPASSGTLALTNDINNATLTIKANGTSKGTFTANASSNVEIDITASDLGLSAAMKFIGISSTAITDGAATNPITVSGNSVTPASGNVVLYGNKEFVWTGSAWEELGNEGSYALSSVTIIGTGALSGGGNLENNREITHNEVLGTAESTAGVYKITMDKYGHIASKSIATASDIEAQPANDVLTNLAAMDSLNQTGLLVFDEGEFSLDTTAYISATKSIRTDYTTAQSTSTGESVTGSGTIALHKIAKTGTYSDLIGAPELADVATSGSYEDLIDLPTLPTVGTLNTTATTAQTTSSSESFSGSITLHKVSKTGSYNDLLNKPTIPTVNNATLTIKQNDTSVGTFTANASSNVAINIETPQILRFV